MIKCLVLCYADQIKIDGIHNNLTYNPLKTDLIENYCRDEYPIIYTTQGNILNLLEMMKYSLHLCLDQFLKII